MTAWLALVLELQPSQVCNLFKEFVSLLTFWKKRQTDNCSTVDGFKLLLGVTHLHAEYYGEVEDYDKTKSLTMTILIIITNR